MAHELVHAWMSCLRSSFFFFSSLSHFVPLITSDPPVLWRTVQRHHGVGRLSDMLDVELSVYIIFSSHFPLFSHSISLYLLTCLKICAILTISCILSQNNILTSNSNMTLTLEHDRGLSCHYTYTEQYNINRCICQLSRIISSRIWVG